MKHKTLVRWALVMVVVFTVTILVYPMIFSPDSPMPEEGVPPATATPVGP